MAVKLILNDTGVANTNFFKKVPMTNNAWSFYCDNGAVVGGTPTYSLSVCNFNGDEADFRAIDEAQLLSLTETVIKSTFNFAFLGVTYRANSATGSIQFYLNIPE